MKINHKSKLLLVAVFAVLTVGGASVGIVHAMSSNDNPASSSSKDNDKETNDDGDKNANNTEDNGKDGEIKDDLNR